MNRSSVLSVLLCCVFLLSTLGPAAAAPPSAASPAVAGISGGINGVDAVAFSPDGKILASGSEDTHIFQWDTATGQLRQTLSGHHGSAVAGLAFSPDGTILASAGRDSVIRLWNVATGQELRALRGHANPARAVAFSPDGKTLASAGEDTRVILWDVATGRLIAILAGHTDFVNTVAFSPDGKTLATGSKDTRIKLWDSATGKERQTLRGHAGEVTSVAFSPDGTSLASAGDDATLRLWDVTPGKQRQALHGPAKRITTVAYSPDGKTLASGGDDDKVILWDTAGGQLRRTLQGHTAAVTGVAFSPDGKTVASGSKDAKVVVWDVATGQKASVIETPPPVEPATATSTASSVAQVASTAAASLDTGPGGPILVITSTASPFGSYYAEILRNEGLNEFAVADIASVSSATLAQYDAAILAEMSLSDDQVTMFGDWVNSGGNLIAMRPDKKLAGLLGLSDAGSTLSNAYLLVDTSKAPGNGIVGQTIQYRSTADLYTPSGSTSVATLYSDAATATGNPAITLISVGANGGQAAAFAYDLARSIIYMRQGNVAWAGQERDAISPIRSDDLYYGARVDDPQPDWVDLNKVAVPQADEQQRLLANLILYVTRDAKPLPRFWYLPRDHKAVVVMTGDDHGNGGTAPRFEQFKADSPANCSVADWECVRGTSYILLNAPLTSSEATSYSEQGFEVALHLDTYCQDYSPESLAAEYTYQLDQFRQAFSAIPPPVTERTHCIPWSDWSSQPKVQLSHGIRLDTNYYYWPPAWVADRPGFFTGSGMPMRFADADGTLIDVYQATTQLTDESGQSYPLTINALLDRALGAEGYYGVFAVNAHTDAAMSDVANAVVSSALSRKVPVVSARQMLDWLDGRNSSSFESLTWNGTSLSFTIAPGAGANGLQALLPTQSQAGTLTGITLNGNPIPVTTGAIKGVEYAAFTASAGAYVATYGVDTTPPAVYSTTPGNGATGVKTWAAVTATFTEAIDPATISTSFELRDPTNTPVAATVSYDAATRTASLKPTASLAASTTYTAIVTTGVKDMAGNSMPADHTWSFATATDACPCSIWDNSATPTMASANDPNPIELGVRFRSDADGYITGIRLYKGSANTGTHVGSLWTNTGQLLAQATFTSETASGWQQVSFASPVPITANTVYVASYFTSSGNYAYDGSYFASSGVDNPPLHALRDVVDGRDGVYAYAGSSTFPTLSYQSANYWVDVVFATSTTPSDTTPPTVTVMTPTNSATNVSVGSSVTTTFSEPLDPVTVNADTLQLLGPSGEVVAANVTYDSATWTATLQPNAALAGSTVYTAVVKGGTTDPRVKDLAGNPLAANYTWSFTTVDTTPPTVTATTPASGATGAGATTSVTASFSELLDPATVSTTTFELRDATSTPVAATVSYDSATRTATLKPSASLALATTYTATVTTGVKDLAGNPLAANYTWSFTTCGSETSPCSIWNDSAESVSTDSDRKATELGVKFRSDVDGYVAGIRFYKTSANTGTHVGSLWTSTGQLLAQAAFAGETASGWQQVSFASPVPITANTVYVASYHTNVGRYAVTPNYFKTTGFDNPPLHALRNGESGSNGVYLYTANSAFPNQTYKSENYWVDVSFAVSTPSDTTPPMVTATTPASGATDVSTTTSVMATFSEPLDPATVSTTTFELRDATSAPVAASVSYDAATRTATLKPSASLALATTYTATVTTGVKDLSGNPLAANYNWSFSTAAPDTTPPTVTTTTPANGATGVSATASVAAAFNEALDPTTINATTFELRDTTSTLVAATVSYDSATRAATLKPTASLPPSTTYTATVTTGVKDLAGNPLAANYTWSFATAATPTTYSIWNGTATSVSTDPDRKATELGVKFRSDVDGQITGIRFYKTSANTGTHVGSLWTSTGQLLARATFTGETASGWQQVSFASPITIAANTVYVASYHTNVGRYAVTEDFFATTGFDNPPLHALRNGESGGNGVYIYSSNPAFPTSTYRSDNYWVDVSFATTALP